MTISSQNFRNYRFVFIFWILNSDSLLYAFQYLFD